MLETYNNFISESSLSLLLENNLYGSSRFLDKLKNISKKSKIAEIMLDLFEDEFYLDKDIAQNYIDITPEDDTISFISDQKASKISNTDLSEYSMKGRGTIKIGRFVRSLFNNPNIKANISNYKDNYIATDKDIEAFVNFYKASQVTSKNKFKLVSGEDIKYWYNEKHYFSDAGTLGSSCMRGSDVSKFFNIYVENPRVCKLLIYINENEKLLGRALVWKLSESPCEAEYFMDRIYVNRDSDVIRFVDYAEEKGWMYKYIMSSDSEEGFLFKYNGKNIFGKITVKLREADFRYYPFVDTISYLDQKEKTLSNAAHEGGEENIIYSLDETSGGKSTCYSCSGKGFIEDTCDECGGAGVIDCDECEGSGDLTCPNCDGEGCKKCDKTGFVECKKCCNSKKSGLDPVEPGLIQCPSCKGEEKTTPCEECVGLFNIVKNDIKSGSHFKEFKNSI